MTKRPRRLPVQIRIDHSTLNMFFDSEIMNLSKGGVFIRADITLPLGSEIEFEFTLPATKKSVNAKGVVVWSRPSNARPNQAFPDHPPGMGIQFRDIDLSDVDAILNEIDTASG